MRLTSGVLTEFKDGTQLLNHPTQQIRYLRPIAHVVQTIPQITGNESLAIFICLVGGISKGKQLPRSAFFSLLLCYHGFQNYPI